MGRLARAYRHPSAGDISYAFACAGVFDVFRPQSLGGGSDAKRAERGRAVWIASVVC